MVKKDLIKKISDKSGMGKKEVQAILDSGIEIIQEKVSEGEPVKIKGFGQFYLRPYGSRTLKMPGGLNVYVPERKIPVFKAGSYFKEICKNR